MTNGDRALNRLAKWRNILAGWQLGTRPTGDGECNAVRDSRELQLLLRAEQSAVVALLIRKGVFSLDEWDAQVELEANSLSESYSKRFPGFIATDVGLEMQMPLAAETMRRMNFPP